MKILWYGLWALLGLLWAFMIASGIDNMVVRESKNDFHAAILNCTYLGSVPDLKDVLYFDCQGRIELHKEITK